MGSFVGHAIPGVFFVLFSLWWDTQLPRRKLLCDQKNIAYFNTCTFPVPLEKFSKYPVEGLAKMVAAVVGMSCELFASLGYGDLKLESMGDIQHFTMYSFFLISGSLDCFVYRGSRLFPQGMDYLALILAFVAEWVIFSHHLDGKTPLEVHVHTLLLYIVAASIIMTICEYHWHSSEVMAFLRCYFTFLQGSWFFQTGFILYPPLPSLSHWGADSGSQRQLITMIFTWHCLADIMIITAVYLVARACYKRHCRILDFRVEHQLVVHGWTLSELRRRRTHGGHVYLPVREGDFPTSVISDEEVFETINEL